jgi:formiminoglutamase
MSFTLKPAEVSFNRKKDDDPRLGHLVGQSSLSELTSDTVAAIIGFPCDEGVRINGGCPGAAQAPGQIRHWLYRFTPAANEFDRHVELLRRCVDLGDVQCDTDVAANQQRLGEVVQQLLQRDIMPIVIGGGHETSFGHFLGYAMSGTRVAIVNLDAHPDVRPLVDGHPHSGSPFRQALQHASGACDHYTVLGLMNHSVAKAHLDFLSSQQANWIWKQDTDPESIRRAIEAPIVPVMVTMDMDVVDERDAPGVSAPNADGLPARIWLEAAFQFGCSPQVRSLDVVEVNPGADVQNRTCRLAALGIWRFLLGMAFRGL